VPAGKLGLRPRPFATVPTPEVPSSAKRDRQRRTASGVTWQRLAISALATPSPAHSKARAWTTFRCGSVVEAAIRLNSARCSSLTDNAAATMRRLYKTLD
jgi:hypothetical protein